MQPQLHVFTKENQHNPVTMKWTLDIDSLKEMPITNKSKVTVLVHGYASEFEEDNWMGRLKNLILNKTVEEYVVIVVDWRNGARMKNYQRAKANTRVVAALIALFVRKLNHTYHIKFESFHLIGHSLGAHIVGLVGKNITATTGYKIGWITGLDPAGPCFRNIQDGLNVNDAEFPLISVLKVFGTYKLLGHIDFFPDGGSRQSSCAISSIRELISPASIYFQELDMLGCSHTAVTKYYSVDYTEFGTCQPVAYECSNLKAFKAGQCASCLDNKCQLMATRFSVGNENIQPKQVASTKKLYYITAKKFPHCNYLYQIVIHVEKWLALLGMIKLKFLGHRRGEVNLVMTRTNEKKMLTALLIIPEKEREGGFPGKMEIASAQYSIYLSFFKYELKITKMEINYMSNIDERYYSQELKFDRN
ncbi:lipase-like protein 1 [Dinothrombium tinctorium]|uniref:Lipase-like protein 1 n=1 Tax=Dinothrombium tinctorium TaxID=1965070 RepID=A0A3S3RPW9_9ACAR|nr:lipase-like protein 1 [Dinothrombium tinctorium]